MPTATSHLRHTATPAGWAATARRVAAAALLALVATACGAGGSHPAAGPGGSAPPTDRTSAPGQGPAPRVRAVLQPWHLRAPLSREAVVAQGRDLVVLGGLDQGGSSVTGVYCLDPRTGAMVRAGALATPTHDAGGAVLGGRDVVVGGGAASVSRDVQALGVRACPGGPAAGSPPTARVTGSLPRPRADLAVASQGGTAYVVGGYDGAALDPTVLATTDGTTFHAVAHLPVPVRYPAVAAARGAVWVMGGEAQGRPTAAIQRIDPSTGAATVVGHLPSPVTGAEAMVLGGRILVLGGDVGGRPSSGIVAVDPATGRAVPAGSLPEAVANAGVAVADGSGWLVGGEGPGALASVVRITLGR